MKRFKVGDLIYIEKDYEWVLPGYYLVVDIFDFLGENVLLDRKFCSGLCSFGEGSIVAEKMVKIVNHEEV